MKPTALIGLSSTPGAFDRQVLERLAFLNEQPIVFPLSNPATQAECSFAEAMEATNNRVIFASGTAFPSYTTTDGRVCVPGQGNNMYIFPGLGLGSILAKTSRISDRMIYSASKALADALTSEELKQGWLYPAISRIREVSAIVATSVIQQSIQEGLCGEEPLKALSYEQLLEHVSVKMWTPTQDAYGENNSRI